MKTNMPCIHKLFYIMRNQFGSYWVMMIGDRPAAEIKKEWLDGLSGFSAELIGKVIADIKTTRPKRPPNLLQIIKMLEDKQRCKIGHESGVNWQEEIVNKCNYTVRDKRMSEINQILNRGEHGKPNPNINNS